MSNAPSIKHCGIYLAVILLIALALRLAAGQIVQSQIDNSSEYKPYRFPDSQNFHSYAKNLSDKGEYVDAQGRRAWRTPAYSLMLATFYKAGISSVQSTRLMQNLLDVFNVYLVFLLGSYIFSKRCGLVAASMFAVYPFYIYFANLILADTLAVTAVLLSAYSFAALLRRIDTQQSYKICAAICGLTFAFAVMVKASFAGLGVFYILFLIMRQLRMPRSTMRVRTGISIALISLMFIAGMSPWWYRNYKVFGQFVPLSTMGGFTLYEASAPTADGGPNEGKVDVYEGFDEYALKHHAACLLPALDWESSGKYIILDPRGELYRDQFLREKNRRNINDNPARFLKLSVNKFLRTWSPVPNYSGAQGLKYKLLCLFSYVPIMLLAAYSLYMYRKKWREVYFLLLPALYLAVVHTIFMGSIRYRLPAMGCIMILAAAIFACKEQKSVKNSGTCDKN